MSAMEVKGIALAVPQLQGSRCGWLHAGTFGAAMALAAPLLVSPALATPQDGASEPSGAPAPGPSGTPAPGSAMRIDFRPFDGAIHPLAALTRGRLTVLADGAVCVHVTPALDDEVVTIGGDAQPAACSTPGAVITFVNGAGQLLHESFLLEPGGGRLVTNFAPRPPHAAHVADRARACSARRKGTHAPPSPAPGALALCLTALGVVVTAARRRSFNRDRSR